MFLAVKCGSIIFVMNNVTRLCYLFDILVLLYLQYNNVNVFKLIVLAMMCLLLLLSIQRCINDECVTFKRFIV